MKRINLFSVVLLLGIVSFGLSELSYENKVFAETLVPCCNVSGCVEEFCTSGSSAEIKQYHPKTGEFLGCTEYIITCRECVDLNAQGEICSEPLNSCKNDDGSCYGWCYTPGVGWGWILQK